VDEIPISAAALAMFAALLAAPAWPAEKHCDKNPLHPQRTLRDARDVHSRRQHDDAARGAPGHIAALLTAGAILAHAAWADFVGRALRYRRAELYRRSAGSGR
jgi:hypothetical protein